MRIKQKITEGWKFHLGDLAGAEKSEFNDESWEILDIPHDWSISQPFVKDRDEYFSKKRIKRFQNLGMSAAFLPGGIGWYRKKIVIPKDWDANKLFIEFDGVYLLCDLWINGKKIGSHHSGYFPFYFHIANEVNWGKENTIAIRVENPPLNSRWYSGSGIYRNLYLISKPQINIGTWCTFIKTIEITEMKAEIQISTEIHTGKGTTPDMAWTIRITDPNKHLVYENTEQINIKDIKPLKLNKKININNPILWSIKNPNLYEIEIKTHPTGISTKQESEIENFIDSEKIRYGLRTFEFDPNAGFWLNGENIKLKGTCNHHDLGCLGAAFNYRARQRQLEILKDMGCNALRTSHNPPEPEFLDLCDEMGFIVMEEAFDEWYRGKRDNGYHKYFRKSWKTDLQSMIKRDRNHACVFIWSVGNELREQRDKNKGVRILKLMKKAIFEFDKTRPITHGCNSIEAANRTKFAETLDIVGYNYFGGGGRNKEPRLDQDHKKYPERIIYGSETASAVRSRGIYHLPLRKQVIKKEEHQCSSYDNCWPNWGSSAEMNWKAVLKRDFYPGEFLWTGFDYLGEPTPFNWPSKSSYFGIVDLCGFPKDIYYFYQSQWRSREECPVLHILPHWNWEGNTQKSGKIPVFVYTNLEKVELFLNDKSLGIKEMSKSPYLHLEWDVHYEPGILRAIALDKTRDNKIICEKSVKTAEIPNQINLIADREEIKANGSDLSFITVEIWDKNGVIVPNADNLVEFNIEGPGKIVGVDNGDSTSHESFKETKRKAFSGKCLCVIQSSKNQGEIVLSAESKCLTSKKIRIKSRS